MFPVTLRDFIVGGRYIIWSGNRFYWILFSIPKTTYSIGWFPHICIHNTIRKQSCNEIDRNVKSVWKSIISEKRKFKIARAKSLIQNSQPKIKSLKFIFLNLGFGIWNLIPKLECAIPNPRSKRQICKPKIQFPNSKHNMCGLDFEFCSFGIFTFHFNPKTKSTNQKSQIPNAKFVDWISVSGFFRF